MKIAFLAAGAGSGYCGACKRDAALAKGLRAMGHDALMLELYTPMRLEDGEGPDGPVFYGGVNVWLEQHLPLYRHAPRFVGWLFDRKPLLKWAGKFALQTRPEDLGPMTVSVLAGAEGRQKRELERLAEFLAGFRPDVAHLTNSLLSGLAPALRGGLGVPVVCSLQGEESFVERTGEPWRGRAVELLRRNAKAVDMFLAPSQNYAEEMAGYLDVPAKKIRIARPGIDLAPFQGERPPGWPEGRGKFRVGFLGRISSAKGLDLLCQAFAELHRRRPGAAELAVAGQAHDNRFWPALEGELAAAGAGGHVEYLGEVTLEEKARFLKGVDVFCTPSRFPERRGIAVLEALASGTPVVVPSSGVFPELVALAGGGVLVPPESPAALADALESLMDAPERLCELARQAAQGSAACCGIEPMTRETLNAYEAVLGES